MKRLILAAFTVLAVSMAFSACEDDNAAGGGNNNTAAVGGAGGTTSIPKSNGGSGQRSTYVNTESLSNTANPGTR